MDLRLIPGAVATPVERDAVDALLGPPSRGYEGATRRSPSEAHVAHGGREARDRRHLLLPALQAAQSRAGWISPGALNYICQRLTVPPAEAYGVASFYALLSTEPQPPVVVHVCDDLACRMNGARELCAELERRFGHRGHARPGGRTMWKTSPCLGQCDQAPAAFVQVAGQAAGDRSLAPATVDAVVDLLLEKDAPSSPDNGHSRARSNPPAARRGGSVLAPQTLGADAERLGLLRRVGRVDPESLDDYRAHGGYAALERALALGPEGVIREVLASKLLGRGGAAFPTGRKWDAVAKAPARPHYLVCNADESEPGTFKDRVLMEEDPFAVIEAMTIAGFATGCDRGFVYVRGEYPRATARLEAARALARARGLLGQRVMGTGLAFDLEIRRGAGAYICGEETALFNSIEGLRGEPRNKPPFPTQVGLFGKPTLVNNVETLVNVLDIVLRGGAAFAAVGTERSSGPKLFCVSGRVTRPGLYEVPFGATLREVIALAGGVRSGRPLRAVLLGGAAGTFVGPEDLDVPLTFEGTQAVGATLGSGVVLVLDDTVDVADLLLRIAAFFVDESCGQCVPCRVGTVRQEESLRRLLGGRPLVSIRAEIALIDEIAQAMRDASICGLGQTASGAIQSALRKLGVVSGEGPR